MQLQSTQHEYPPVMIGSVNLAPDSRDHGMLRRMAMNPKAKRWPIDDDLRDQLVAASKVALRMAIEKKDDAGINNVVRTMVLMESQNQRDEHHAEGEKSTVEHSHRHIVVKPGRVLEQ